METKKIISVLSKADTVEGQGVGSAYLEQVRLVKEGAADKFELVYGQWRTADLVHVHTINPEFFGPLKNAKAPTVMYCHVLPDTLEGSIKLPKGIFKLFKNYLVSFYTHADYVVVVNPIFIEPLVALGVKRERVVYIPNFVNHDDFCVQDAAKIKETRLKFGIDPNAFVVLGVGQVQTRKGVKDFVDVALANPSMTFVWAGGFSFKGITDGFKELKEIMDNPPANVKFLGIIPRDNMNDIFNMANVLFMPSYNELFPMAILEAANSKTPMLLRNLDLYQNILFSAYLKADDNDGFSSILRNLQQDEKFYETARKYSEKISDYYSAEHVLQIWVDFYTKLIDQKEQILVSRKYRIKSTKRYRSQLAKIEKIEAKLERKAERKNKKEKRLERKALTKRERERAKAEKKNGKK